jgi:hypothetical protein
VLFGVAEVVLGVIEMQLVSFSAHKRKQEKSDSVNMIHYYGWTSHRAIQMIFRETPAKQGDLTEALEEGPVSIGEWLRSTVATTQYN